MRHSSALSVFLILIVHSRCQKNEGDSCVDQYTNTIGQCKPAESCQSARNDFQQNGIRPTFCTYSAFGATLVCCRDGTTILQTADNNSNRPSWGTTSNKQSDGRRVSDRNDPITSGKPPVEPYIHNYGKDDIIIQDTFHAIKPTATESIEDRDFSIKDKDSSVKDKDFTVNENDVPPQETEEDLLTKVWALKLKKLLSEQRRYAIKIINDVLFEAETGGLNKQHLNLLQLDSCGAKNVSPLSASAIRSAMEMSTNDDGVTTSSTYPPILQLKLTVNNPEMP